MIASEQLLIEKSTGNTFEFIETGKETKGERITVKVTLNSRGKYAPSHIHIIQDETFKVLSGKMTYTMNGIAGILSAGEHIIMPRGISHNHYNDHEEPLTMIQTIEPALDIDYYIMNYVGLSNDGKIKNGDAGIIQNMVTIKYLDSPFFLSVIPIPIQKMMSHLIGPIARMFGYRALYPKYTGKEK